MSPTPTSGRKPYPGETVLMTITLQNLGDWVATGLTGAITVANAEVREPPRGDLSLVPIPPIQPSLTADINVIFRVDPAVSCPADLNVEISDLASNGGAVTHGLTACSNPFLVVDDCSRVCEPACDVGALPSLGNSLKAVKTGVAGSDIRFGWQDPGSEAAEYHVNWVQDKTNIIDAKRAPAGSGIEASSKAAPASDCIAAGETTTPELQRFYQAVAACGATGDLEGPK